MQHPSQPSSPYFTPRDRGTPGSERPTGQSPSTPSLDWRRGGQRAPTHYRHQAGSSPATINPRLAFTPEVEDLALAGDIPTLPAALATLAAVPGVAAASGDITVTDTTVVDVHNAAVGLTNGAPALARNWYPSRHSPTLTASRAPTRPGEIAVDATGAARHHAQLGDRLRVITPTTALPITVVGITRQDGPNPGVATVYFDTPRPKISCAPSPAGSPRSPSTLPPAAPTPLCGNVCRPHSAPATPSGNGPHRRTGATPPHPRRQRHRAEPPRPHLTLLLVTR